MGTNQEDNRRSNQRLEQCLPAWYRADHRNFQRSSVLDVSEGGARLFTSDPIPEHGEIHVTVKLGGDQHVTVVGRPAWQRPLRRGTGYLVGVQFQEGGGPDAGVLARWIRRHIFMNKIQGVA